MGKACPHKKWYRRAARLIHQAAQARALAEISMRLTPLAIATAPALFVLLWSTGFIGARFGLPHIEPLTFLAVRMAFVVLTMAAIAIIGGAPRPDADEVGHSLIAGSLVHGLYLGGVFTAISQGVPAGISALIPGLQPIVTSTIANRFMGERVTQVQWVGLVLGLVGVLLVLHDRSIVLAGSALGWVASFLSLVGITLGTLYQKRYCGGIDWRAGNLIQYIGAAVLFALAAFAFETREIRWSGELIFAIAWLVLVLSIAAVGLMYWLIRRTAATGFASLFYLVPALTALFAFFLFGERLDALSILGMVICAGGVLLANRGAARPREL
jgi:drug/metabolite transporter (DMT)-like permease